MNEQLENLYKNALRFDEGEVFQGEAYHDAKRRQLHLYDLLVATFGSQIEALLNDYTDTLFEEMECEAQHYFQEGYRAAQQEQSR